MEEETAITENKTRVYTAWLEYQQMLCDPSGPNRNKI